jgi:hypothetical protein
MKAYLGYELSRLDSVVNKKVRLESVLLHQLVTDLALALNLDWLFKDYINYLSRKKITFGFNTGNFVYLIKKFDEWKIDLSKVLILAPFYKVGFQMMPSIEKCEQALGEIPSPVVVAMSVLAAGVVKPRTQPIILLVCQTSKELLLEFQRQNMQKKPLRYLRVFKLKYALSYIVIHHSY